MQNKHYVLKTKTCNVPSKHSKCILRICSVMQLNSDFPNGLTNLAVSPPFRLTSELLVVSRDHHGELPGVRVVQAGEELLLSCGGEEVLLLLVACQVHHPGSDVCYYDHLKRKKHKIATLVTLAISCFVHHLFCIIEHVMVYDTYSELKM